MERASRQVDLITSGRVAEGAVDERIESVVAAENRGCVNPRPPADPATAQQGTDGMETCRELSRMPALTYVQAGAGDEHRDT